jgi:hypothetical protein
MKADGVNPSQSSSNHFLASQDVLGATAADVSGLPSRKFPESAYCIDIPVGCEQAYVTAHATAYQCCDGEMRGTLMGGVLPAGRIVWACPLLRMRSMPRQVPVFVGELGMILLNREHLKLHGGMAQPRSAA